MKNIYQYNNYRDLLADRFGKGEQKKRGHLIKIAKITKCQSAYISQIFAYKSNLSLEQGAMIAEQLVLNNEEKEYFFDLIMVDRAGNSELENFYKQKIEAKRKLKQNLTKHLNQQDEISIEVAKKYYSHWAYAAIHIIVGIKNYRDIYDIAEKLEISKRQVSVILNDLVTWGYVIEEAGKYYPGKATLHLDDENELIKTHHQNWRFKAIQSINEKIQEGFHYSSVTCVSKETRDKIKFTLLKCVDEVRKEIRSSEEDEVLYGINLDFYEV